MFMSDIKYFGYGNLLIYFIVRPTELHIFIMLIHTHLIVTLLLVRDVDIST